MEAVIFGAGLVGTTIGKELTAQGHNVVLVDQDPGVVTRVRETLDVQVLRGYATDRETQRRAGLATADLILALTNSDESNIVIAMLAQAQNDKARIIARVRGQNYLESRELWKGDHFERMMMFSPEMAAVETILELLTVEQAFEVITFASGAIKIAGFALDERSPLLGRKLQDLHELTSEQILLVAVQRAGKIEIPSGKTVLQAKDRVYVTRGNQFTADHVKAVTGVKPRAMDKMVIAGGGKMGERVAARVSAQGVAVTIIERSRDRCHYLAERLAGVTVIHGDCTERELLAEELVSANSFLALTGHQEVSFLTGLLAKELGAPRVMVVLDNEAYLDMAHTLGISAAVSPKLAAVGTILRTLRSGMVIDSSPMLNGRLEALFIEVVENSRLAGISIMDANLPRGMIVAAVIRNGNTIVPKGNLVINRGDRALLVAPRGLLRKMDDFLSLVAV